MTERDDVWTVVLFRGGCWAAYHNGELAHEGWSAEDTLSAMQEMRESDVLRFGFWVALDDDPPDRLEHATRDTINGWPVPRD